MKLTETEEEKIQEVCGVLLNVTYINKAANRELYNFIVASKNQTEIEKRFDALGFNFKVDDNKETAYIKPRFKINNKIQKKIPSLIGVLLIKHFIESSSSISFSEYPSLRVHELNEEMIEYVGPVKEKDFKDILWDIFLYHNLISLSCSHKKDFSMETNIMIYPSILCWCNLNSEETKFFLEETIKEKSNDVNNNDKNEE